MVFIKPSAFEIHKAKICQSGKRQGIECQLSIWFFPFGIGLVIKDMNIAIPDLKKVNMASEYVF